MPKLHYFVFLFISHFAISQDTLFSENFNTCTLSDQWTFKLTGNQNVAWGVGLPSNTKAGGSSINGSCMLFIDDDLTGDKTPPFNLRIYSAYFDGRDYSDITFSARVHFRRDKTEYMKIIIDNGEKEHVIREFKGRNYSGEKFSNYIDMVADLSFIATDSMRIIIEYDDDNQFGWWAGIDDISVTGKKGGKIILGETFNTCALPAGWSTEILSGVNDWQYGIFTDGRSIDGTCFAYFNDDILGEDAPLSKIRMYSPLFSASEYANYQLTYDFIFRFYEASEYLQLYVDNGKEWIPVKTYNGDFGGPNVDAFKKDTIDLSPYRNEQIRLIWEYNDGGWAWWLGLDNVKIVGQGDLNDRCLKAKPIVANANCVQFDNTNALRDDELTAISDNHTGFLYYTFTAPESATFEMNTMSAFNDILEVYSGNCVNHERVSRMDKDEYGFHGESVFISALAGAEYIIRIYGTQADFGLEKGMGCIAVTMKADTYLIPPGEKCHTAMVLQAEAECQITKNIKAKLDGPAPTTNQRSRADVWFVFTPSMDGDYKFSSQADFADAVALFAGNCESLVELKSNFNGQELVINQAQAGVAYYIQVTGYFATLEGSICPVIRRITSPPVVDHVDCLNAFQMTINTPCTTISNNGAGFSGIHPSCDVYLYDDVWFSFIAPPTKEIFLRVKTDFEKVVSLYEGNCSTLSPVYCNKNFHHCNGFLPIRNLTAGKRYLLQIGSKSWQGQYKTGQICVEMRDTEPAWQKIHLQVVQECVSKGAVKFIPAATGGTGNFTYEGLGIQEAVAGNDQYIIQATDGEGCIQAVLVDAVSCNDYGCTVAAVINKKDALCYGSADGAANIQINGGLEPYLVQWPDNTTGLSASNLLAGSYTVTISDGSGCELVENIQIQQPAQIISNPAFTPPACYNDTTGAISLFVIGGNGQYAYLWKDGSTENSLQKIAGGNYDVTITDAAGCLVSETLTLIQPDEISISGTLENNLCFGDKNGLISADIKGGTLPYSITWNVGNGLYNDSLFAGIYLISVVDKNNCSSTRTWEVTQPQLLTIGTDSLDLIIDPANAAFIDASIQGGTPPYEYDWYFNGTTLSSHAESITTYDPGMYHLIVTDDKGCTATSQNWEVIKTSGVIDEDNSGVRIHPNPTADFLNIFFDKPALISRLALIDVEGKMIKNIPTAGFQWTKFYVGDVITGTYTLSWMQGEKTFTKKVIIIH